MYMYGQGVVRVMDDLDLSPQGHRGGQSLGMLPQCLLLQRIHNYEALLNILACLF